MSAFARIPGGWFVMGSDTDQPDEAPAHRVWVDTFELAVDRGEVLEVDLEPATAEETEATVAVMGGEDWEYWIASLQQADGSYQLGRRKERDGARIRDEAPVTDVKRGQRCATRS